MRHDLRHALRAITRAKGISAVFLLSLGLGTGANAAVYGVLDALLRRAPAGVGNPSTLLNVYTSEYSGSPYGPSSFADFLAIQQQAASFSAVAAIDDRSVENIRLETIGLGVRIAEVSDRFFDALQMPAHEGRLLALADAEAASAVVSHKLAEQIGDGRSVIGRTLTIAEREYEIVGVTPPRFRGLRMSRDCDVWIPLAAQIGARGDRRLAIVARLAPRASAARAAADLQRIAGDLAERYPDTNRGSINDANALRLITATPYSPLDPAGAAQAVLVGLVIGGASTLLLAAACLNVGGLLLSWSLARQRELAIKLALGATRATLVRQMLTEALCLSLAGGTFGLLVAAWTTQIVPALFASEQAARLDTRLDASTLLLTIGVACAAGMLFSIAPTLRGTAIAATTALRADAGGVGQQGAGARLRAFLVSGQVTLSTVLLLATGLLVASLDRALQGDLGATVKQIAVISTELPGRFGDQVRGVRARTALLERLPKLDGIVRVGWASTLPLARGNTRAYGIEGGTSAVTDLHEFETNLVSPSYFDVLSLRIVEGRAFDDGDSTLAPAVVIIDELLARRYFGARAIGHHLIDAQGGRAEIVGVVQSGRYRTLQQAPQPTVYHPMTQVYLYVGSILLRTSGDPALRLDDIGEAIGSAKTGASVLRKSTLDDLLAESLAVDRLATTLVGGCGLIALAMSTLGVYGIMTDAVQRRTREIGLRVALGARPRQIVRLILAEATYPAAVGLLVGAGASIGLVSIARSLVFGMPPVEIAPLAMAAAALVGVILVAAIAPLRRALRVHPNIALRVD
jgi:predicted permease